MSDKDKTEQQVKGEAIRAVPMYGSKISRWGLGPEVLAMRKLGHKISNIAEVLGVGYKQVADWLYEYDRLPAKEQREYLKLMEQNSVFNLREQMEQLFKDTKRMTAFVEDNPELYGKYLDQQRKQLQLAGEIMEKATRLEMHKQALNVILSIISKVDDDTRKMILKELESRPEIKGFLT